MGIVLADAETWHVQGVAVVAIQPRLGAEGEGKTVGRDLLAHALIVIAVGVAIHRQGLRAAVFQGDPAARQLFMQALVIQPGQDRVAGTVRAEANQPGIFEHAHLGPVQGLGLGTLGQASVSSLSMSGSSVLRLCR